MAWGACHTPPPPWNPLEIIVVSKTLLHYIAKAIINDNFFFSFFFYNIRTKKYIFSFMLIRYLMTLRTFLDNN